VAPFAEQGVVRPEVLMLATNGSPHTEAPLKIDDRSLEVGGAVDQVVDWELRLAGRPGQRTAGPTGATVHEP
jgi:hypothetical protein